MKEDKKMNAAVSNFIPPFPSLYCILMSSVTSQTEQPCFRIVPVQVDAGEVMMVKDEVEDSEGEPEPPIPS